MRGVDTLTAGRGSIALAVAIASLVTAGSARAQAFAPPPVVPVEIEGSESGSSIEVLIQGDEFLCGRRCALSLVPGAYNLRVTDAAGHLSRENLYVRGPVRATVTPANRAARITGIVFMGVALVGAAAGALGAFRTSEIRMNSCDPYALEGAACEGKTAPWLYTSAIGLGAAVAFGFTGFHLWDQNKTAGIELAPLDAR
jgi:hypothetical protein